MKPFAFILPCLVTVFFSCSSPGQPEIARSLPADSVIPEKKMMSLLVDVHLLEGGLMVERNRGEVDSKFNQEAYRKLFLKYHITSSQFIRNMGYYQNDAVNFTRIYDTVIQRINRLKKTKV
ncbi:MAG: DUF4296 domain-containing protein [Bacteroidota bacterium]|jgi:Domain of unknown function (DUF4296)